MDAVFTLPYSEFAVAELFGKEFKKKDSYSVLVPVSRTEKGFDLVLARRFRGSNRCLTFQVKSSRTYAGTQPKRKSTAERYRFYTWFNRFVVPQQADFVVLFGLYPADDGTGRKHGHTWWRSLVLVFTREEMESFLRRIKTKRTGTPERMFSFGFNDSRRVFLTRGNAAGEYPEYSEHLFKHKKRVIAEALV